MPVEYLSFEDRDLLLSRGWTRVRMHSSKRTDWWTHPVHSVRNTPKYIPTPREDEEEANAIDFTRPGFVHLTREQALRLEGIHRSDVVRSV